MKAIAINPTAREIGVIDTPAPELRSDTDVKIRILDVGVCGTDREICAFDYGTPPAGSPHLILGHETVGEVVEVGAAVRGLKAGDLVVPTVRRPCARPACVACRSGRQDYCQTGEFVERGINQMHGFMTELVVDDEHYMNRVPAALREAAVLVEPLTIAEKALAQARALRSRLPWEPAPGLLAHDQFGAGRRALVLGAGPVGLLGAMTLVAAGFETFVYARGAGPSPRRVVLDQIGATYVSSEQVPLDAMMRHTGGVDVVFEATGSSGLSLAATSVLDRNGVFLLTGVPGRRGPIPVDADRLMRDMVLQNQVLCGSVNAGKSDFESAILDLAQFQERWPEAVRALVSGRHPLESARDLLVRPPAGIKEVISFAAATA